MHVVGRDVPGAVTVVGVEQALEAASDLEWPPDAARDDCEVVRGILAMFEVKESKVVKTERRRRNLLQSYYIPAT